MCPKVSCLFRRYEKNGYGGPQRLDIRIQRTGMCGREQGIFGSSRLWISGRVSWLVSFKFTRDDLNHSFFLQGNQSLKTPTDMAVCFLCYATGRLPPPFVKIVAFSILAYHSLLYGAHIPSYLLFPVLNCLKLEFEFRQITHKNSESVP